MDMWECERHEVADRLWKVKKTLKTHTSFDAKYWQMHLDVVTFELRLAELTYKIEEVKFKEARTSECEYWYDNEAAEELWV